MTTYTVTATATTATTNRITVATTDNMFSGMPIVFSGTTFGGITAGATYYIGTITVGYPTSTITVNSLPGGGVYVLTTATGTMTGTFNSGGQQIISTVPPGEPLNESFNAVNLNFDQVFAAGPVGSNIQIANNTIRTTNTNGNLVLAPNGIGIVQANTHVIPDQNRIRNLGSPTRYWDTVYAWYGEIPNANIGNASTINIAVANLHVSGGSNGYVLQTDGTGNLTWTAQTGGSGNGTPGGANTQVQFNDAGTFGGQAGFTFDKTSNVLSVNNVSAGTVYSPNFYGNAIVYANATGYLTNTNLFTYNSGNQTLTVGTVSTTGNVISGNLNSPTLNNSGNISVVAGSNTWTFGSTGSTIFPTLTVTRGDVSTGTITGQTLLFGDNTQEAIISTPNGNVDYISSQRLVINPGNGYNSGEGGDIYLWAGRGGADSGSGGDVKIRGGFAPADGPGGYIRIEGGNSQANGAPGFIEITGGEGGNTTGGYVRILGGQGQTDGGDANLTGGFGTTGTGGDVNIVGGISGNGLADYGNVNISAGASTWTFDNTGSLTLPNGATLKDNSANALAIGQSAGILTQGQNAVAIGTGAGSGNIVEATYVSGAYPSGTTLVVNDTTGIRQYSTVTGTGFTSGQVVLSVDSGTNLTISAVADSTPSGTLAFSKGPQQNDSVAIGTNAGQYDQERHNVAIGTEAGMNNQGEDSVAIGWLAGRDDQTRFSIAIGWNAGSNTQGQDAQAYGRNAGAYYQQSDAIAIGESAGRYLQKQEAIAIGYASGFGGTYGEVVVSMQASNIVRLNSNTGLYPGMTVVGGSLTPGNGITITSLIGGEDIVLSGDPPSPLDPGDNLNFYPAQGPGAIAIGSQAAQTLQGQNAIAVGYQAGRTRQGSYSIAIGEDSGQTEQGIEAVAIGRGAGNVTQANTATAVGSYAGNNGQGIASVAMGFRAGYTGQGNSSVALGEEAGYQGQGINAVAVGYRAGNNGQGIASVAMGFNAGYTGQGNSSVALGEEAGYQGQGQNSIAIGRSAGQTTQGIYGVAIGFEAGQTTQGNSAVAVGENAGYNTQGISAVAIGDGAGRDTQGQYAVAIGYGAGNSNQANNSIIINATGSVLEQTTANTFTVKPIRSDTTGNVLYYDESSGEITFGVGGGAANTGNVTFSDQIVIGTGISNLISGLYLSPSSSSANAVQYLRVRGDVTYEPTHIHFDTGNNQYFNQFIGDDNKYVLLSNIGDIVIRTDDYAGNSAQWTFGADGNLTIPGNILGGGNILIAPDSANSGGYLDIYLTTGPDIHVASNGDSNLILGRDSGPNVLLGTSGNVSIQASNGTPHTWTFDTNGNLSAPGNISATGNVTGGNLVTAGSGGNITLTGGNITGANVVGATGLSLSGNVLSSLTVDSYIYSTGNVTTGANLITQSGYVYAGGNVTGGNILTGGLISATGNITGGNISAVGKVTAANFVGNGNTLSNVATTFESAWTVPTGNSTQNFTVTAGNTYLMWVDCNIPNGILVWNATGTVTNTNVPVVGYQYAWVYDGGGTPIDFTSIPNQFIGTANTIVRSNTAPSSTTNRFDFGINNTSGGNVTVRYGWVQIS